MSSNVAVMTAAESLWHTFVQTGIDTSAIAGMLGYAISRHISRTLPARLSQLLWQSFDAFKIFDLQPSFPKQKGRAM
jgi:hypothetical protein